MRIPYGGGFKIDMPEKGFVGFGTTFDLLMKSIRTYRFANGLPNGLGLDDEVEAEICKLYPLECEETDIRIPKTNQPFTFLRIVNGTKAAIAHRFSGKGLVQDAVANSRSEICSRCPNNVNFDKPCGGVCGELEDIAKVLFGTTRKETPYSPMLNACAICGCYLNVAVWIPVQTQFAVLTEEQRIQYQTAGELYGCWKQSTATD